MGYKFKYEGLDAIDDFNSSDCHSGYYHFTVKLRDTNERVIDFYTNGYFEGMFHANIYRGIYVQDMGTCQFSLPRSSKRRLRDTLRRMAIKSLEDPYEESLREYRRLREEGVL